LACVLAFAFSGAARAVDISSLTPRAESPQDVFARIRSAAEGGDAKAMFAMGGLYVEGLIVQRNFSTARDWYEKSANAGLAEGVFNVGVCWETGLGSAADPAKAAEFFKRAADMNLPQALFKMSVILDGGIGVKRDEEASVGYMERAARAGHPDAASIMGLAYLNGLRGRKKDPAEGMRLLKIAAAAGNAEAMKNMAVVYKDGIGTPVSPVNSLKWYVIAEKCGYPAEALAAVTAELRGKLSPEQQKRAESEADAWINEARAAAERRS
jgi:TPR repeat protein